MRVALLVPALLVVACVGTGRIDESYERPAEERPSAELVPMEGEDTLDRERVHLPADAKSRSFNATITSDDPMGAMNKARTLLEELGVDMLSVSSAPQYANVSGRLPNGKCAALPSRVRALGFEMASENLAVSDLKPSVQWIEERLDRLDRADREVRRMLRAVADETTADGLLVLRELAANERRNLDQQITSYADQARYCQVYINVQTQQQPVVLDH